MQGSGTFGIESVVSSTVPPDGKLFVISNGAYGKRILKMASILKIETSALRFEENEKPDLTRVRTALAEDDRITNVAVIHCETTTGILNPIEEIGRIVKDAPAISTRCTSRAVEGRFIVTRAPMSRTRCRGQMPSIAQGSWRK